MKNLYLLRHAKSSWDAPALSDGERPLNVRGRRDAPRMGEALGTRLVPMTFHVSPAERAQQTFRAVQKNWKGLRLVVLIRVPEFAEAGAQGWVKYLALELVPAQKRELKQEQELTSK